MTDLRTDYLPDDDTDDVDHAGHGKTWEGPEYKAAVEEIDSLIGKLTATVPLDKTLIVLVADHPGRAD